MTHCSNGINASFFNDNRLIELRTGFHCNTTTTYILTVVSVWHSSIVVQKGGLSSEQRADKAIDHLVVNQLPNVPLSSSQTLLHFRLYHYNRIGHHWTFPRLHQTLSALPVGQTLIYLLSLLSSRSGLCTLQPHTIKGESALALPLN